MLKRKRVMLSLEQKVSIVNRIIGRGESVKKLSEEFGIGETTVRDLIKKKDKIFEFLSSGESPSKLLARKSMKKSTLHDLESALFEWFKQKRADGSPISGPMLCEKALCLHKSLNINEPFTASQGWLYRFKDRYDIRLLEIQGVRLNGDLADDPLFNNEFHSIVSKLNLSPDQIYTAVDFDLYWKMVPSKALPVQSEKSYPGNKYSNERLTIMTCSNLNGTHKIKLTVIGKTQEPQLFKETEVKSLPCDYFSHRNAWMDQALFKQWFFDIFVPSVNKFQEEKMLPKKAILLLDNAPSHPSETSLKTENGQICIYFPPPNVSSLLLSINQGVIACLKLRYKKIFLRFLLQENCFDSLNDLLKTWTVRDAIFAVCEGWESLSSSTLRFLWAKILDQDCTDKEYPDEEDDIKACLLMAYSIPYFCNVDKDYITDWIRSKENEDGYDHTSDNDIVAIASRDTSAQSDFEVDDNVDNDGLHFEGGKIQPTQAMEAIDILMTFCEQQSFNLCHLQNLRNIKSEVRKRVTTSKQKKKK